MNFTEILEDYENTLSEIESVELHYSVATEAETTDTVDNTTKKESKFDHLMKVLSEMIRILLANIDTFKEKIKNSFQNFMMTNQGFEKQLRIAETRTTPANAVRLITYTYNNQVLETPLSKFTQIVNIYANKFDYLDTTKNNNPDDLLMMEGDKLEKYILNKLGANEKDTRFKLYLQTLKKEFRGEKSEKIIKKSEIPNYRKYISNINVLETRLTKLQLDVARQVKDIDTKIRIKIKSPNVSDEQKNTLKKRLTNITKLFSMYTSFLEVYYLLKVEQILNARVVLKRLYRF